MVLFISRPRCKFNGWFHQITKLPSEFFRIISLQLSRIRFKSFTKNFNLTITFVSKFFRLIKKSRIGANQNGRDTPSFFELHQAPNLKFSRRRCFGMHSYWQKTIFIFPHYGDSNWPMKVRICYWHWAHQFN